MAQTLFDLEIYRYRIEQGLLRLTHAMSFRANERREVAPAPDNVLPLGKRTVNCAVKTAFDFLGERLPAASAGKGGSILVLLDDAGLEMVQDWHAEEIAFLSWWSSNEADYTRIVARPLEYGIRTFKVHFSDGGRLGFVREDGDFRLLELDHAGHERHATKASRGWKMIALKIGVALTCQAPALLSCFQAEKHRIDVDFDCERVFWREIAKKAEDPFVRPRPIIVRQSGPQYDASGFDVANVAFEHGSASDLWDLTEVYFRLLLSGRRAKQYFNAFRAQEQVLVTFLARHETDEPSFFDMVPLHEDGSRHRFLGALIRLMNPTGYQLSGGPRISQAKKVQAHITCVLKPWRLGIKNRKLELMSAHEQIALTAKLVDFLTANGMPEEKAQKLLNGL